MCFYNKLVHLLILFFLVGLNINFSGIKASYNGDICTTEQNVEFSDCFEHCFNHFSEKDRIKRTSNYIFFKFEEKFFIFSENASSIIYIEPKINSPPDIS